MISHTHFVLFKFKICKRRRIWQTYICILYTTCPKIYEQVVCILKIPSESEEGCRFETQSIYKAIDRSDKRISFLMDDDGIQSNFWLKIS